MSTYKKIAIWPYLVILLFATIQANAQSSSHINHIKTDSLPVIPVGLDAYRNWDQWPMQRIGARAYMRSTYDRSGGNETADAGHFLYMGEDEDFNVTLDVQGKGVLYFIRTNHWHGSPWHYVVDGNDYLVKETGTADPVHAIKKFNHTTFNPKEAFPEPLAFTWGQTKGADLMWVPIGFEKSLQLAYSRTHYGTGYYIYKKYANNRQLSHPIRAWNIDQTPDNDVLKLIDKAGTDIAPKDIEKKSGTVKLDKKRIVLSKIDSAPAQVRLFKLTLPLEKAVVLERLRLQVTWDGADQPSIDAPLSLFFGAGTLYNRDQSKYLVKGFPINIRFDYENQQVQLACYYPMPFFKSAKFEITGIEPQETEIGYEIRYEPYKAPPAQSSYFHATYHDFTNPKLGKDLVLLDTKGIEGHTQWAGSFVGTSFIFSHDSFLRTLEGDPRFFFDDSETPQAYGTGTEEWGGGGDYWGGRNMTLPFAGHPVGAPSRKAKNDKDRINSAYRFLLGDLMPFGRRAEIHLEHGAENLSSEHYETVTYWYGLPAPSLIKTDSIDVGNKNSENRHNYHSPEASEVQHITSRYEWGIDTFPKHPKGMNPNKISGYKQKIGQTVFPAQTKDGRYTQGTSEFTTHISPDNLGVLLRRTLDYSFPNQKAQVYISGADHDAPWKFAGMWYLAGSNTVVYSNPRGEMGKREYKVQTSNRRFRDDEFLIPAKLTKRKSKIRVRLKFIPVNRELYPGKSYPKKSAWSELHYDIFSYRLPSFSVGSL